MSDRQICLVCREAELELDEEFEHGLCSQCHPLDSNGEIDLEYLEDLSRLLSDVHLDDEAVRVRVLVRALEDRRDDV